MKFAIIVVFSTFAVFSAAKSVDESQDCNCMPVDECESIMLERKELVRPSGDIISNFYNSKKRCSGFRGFTPKFCCPDSPSNKVRPTTESTSVNSEEENLSAVCGRQMDLSFNIGNRTELPSFPWLALLEYNTNKGREFLCGGVLISDRFVLTAAHCIRPDLVNVRLGEHDISKAEDCMDEGFGETRCFDKPLNIDIEATILYEEYTDMMSSIDHDRSNDIALIKLKQKVHFTELVSPICLPTSNPDELKVFTVAGWGKSISAGTKGFNTKLKAKLSHDQKACENNGQLQSIFDSNSHICVKTRDLKYERNEYQRPCIADGGGPLMANILNENGQRRYTVFGVSFLELSCDMTETSNMPGVFTDVYKHIDWIREHIRA